MFSRLLGRANKESIIFISIIFIISKYCTILYNRVIVEFNNKFENDFVARQVLPLSVLMIYRFISSSWLWRTHPGLWRNSVLTIHSATLHIPRRHLQKRNFWQLSARFVFFWNATKQEELDLPSLYWIPKLHSNNVT